MESNIFTAIITLVSTVVGAFLGWFLAYMQTYFFDKVRLSFSLQPYKLDEVIDPELQTKYSESGDAIYAYNTGKTPFLDLAFVERKRKNERIKIRN